MRPDDDDVENDDEDDDDNLGFNAASTHEGCICSLLQESHLMTP